MLRSAFLLGLALILLTGCAAPLPGEPQPGLETRPAIDETGQPLAAATAKPLPSPTPAPTLVQAGETLPSPTAVPVQEPEPAVGDARDWIAYTGADGNLWLVDLTRGEPQPITEDAVPWQVGSQEEGPTRSYCCGRWSSDGRFLAYVRETGIPVPSGYQYRFDLWVYERETGESRLVLENQQTAGFDWQPGTHRVAYGLPIHTEFFLNNSPDFAQGIWVVDVETGEREELVPPLRGYPLVSPTWSPDGRLISFDEVFAMEGRGWFAYYDIDAGEYIAWEEVIGSYTWAPDGEQIAYDNLAYIPQGTERIWLRDRQAGAPEALSADFPQGYAFSPVFSPQGDRLAYLAELGGPETFLYTLFVLDLGSGEAVNYGVFEQVQDLSWTSDGARLVFGAGPYDQHQVTVVNLADGTVEKPAAGRQPAPMP